MLTLALDCSTSRGGVALGGACGVLCAATFAAGRGRGGELFAATQEALAAAEAGGGRIGEIVVGLGPGSYSGVRQSIALAAGLGLALGARVSGAPSVAALETDAAEYIALGDARRGTFYHTAVRGGLCVAGPELVEDEAALLARLGERSGWLLLAVEAPLPGVILPQVAAVAFPSAERLLTVPPGARRLAPLEPIYLRPPSVTLPRAAARP